MGRAAPWTGKKDHSMPSTRIPTYTVQAETLESYATCWTLRDHALVWPGPFMLPPWLTAWWASFAGDHTPCLLSIHNRNQLVGLAPLMRKDREVQLVGDVDLCDHLDFVVVPSKARAFYRCLLDYLAADGIRRLALVSVRADASAMTSLLPVAEKWGARVRCARQAQLFAMPLPGSWEAYLKGLNGKVRHEIRRKLRRLEAAGRARLRCVRSPAALPEAMDAFMTLFRANRAAKAAFMTGPMPAFFRCLADNLATADLLRLYFLDLDEQAIAAAMCFDYRDTVYLYNNGYDDAFRALSPGLLSKVLTIQESIRDGYRVYDFLKGAEKYKQHLGGQPVNLYRCELEWDLNRVTT
jgi:CelD/BcsL family acetyltransferase involved in cellulose biosynthesis